jgi:plastocyanin
LNFEPSTITLVIGINNTVIWTSQDVSLHNVASTSVPNGAQSFICPNFSRGGTYTQTFMVAGTYQYVCQYHAWMKGTIVVVAAS